MSVIAASFKTPPKKLVKMAPRDHSQALREMRAAGSGYVAPPDACASYQSLYQTLAEFETDLHQHIHLENNILFPRAIEMERGVQARP